MERNIVNVLYTDLSSQDVPMLDNGICTVDYSAYEPSVSVPRLLRSQYLPSKSNSRPLADTISVGAEKDASDPNEPIASTVTLWSGQ